MKYFLIILSFALASCTGGDDLASQTKSYELGKLKKQLIKTYGENKFTNSFYDYVEGKTEVTVKPHAEGAKEIDVEVKSVNKKVIEGLMMTAMMVKDAKNKDVSFIIDLAEKKSGRSVASAKPTILQGKCFLENLEGKAVVKKCKFP